eukprot:5531481-Prymnesium_polylepis.2
MVLLGVGIGLQRQQQFYRPFVAFLCRNVERGGIRCISRARVNGAVRQQQLHDARVTTVRGDVQWRGRVPFVHDGDVNVIARQQQARHRLVAMERCGVQRGEPALDQHVHVYVCVHQQLAHNAVVAQARCGEEWRVSSARLRRVHLRLRPAQ